MRVLQIVSTYPPYKGGMGHVAHTYTEGLKAKGVEVEVVCPAYGQKLEEEDPKYIHRMRPLFSFGNAAFLPWIPNLKKFDIVHIHYPFFGAVEPLLLRLFFMKHPPKIVLTYHMDPTATGWREKFFRLHEKIILPLLVKKASRVLVSSFEYADFSALGEIPKAKQIREEFPFGVDIARFFPGENIELRKSLCIPEAEPVILFVGGMDTAHAFKGVPVFLRALSGLKKPFQAVLVGDGDLRSSFESLAASLGISARVHFLGSVKNEELPGVYRAADLHVLPSTEVAEAFGLVTLEAAASGLPSIVSDLPGVRHVIEDGVTGAVVFVGDIESLQEALSGFISNKAKCQEFGQNARKRVESKYTWDKHIDRLLDLYTKIMPSSF